MSTRLSLLSRVDVPGSDSRPFQYLKSKSVWTLLFKQKGWHFYSTFHSSLCDTESTYNRVKLTDDGKKALLRLSKGDMRLALNVVQACHAAYDLTGETEVYNCTGNPQPADIATIVNSMFSDEFTTSYNSELSYTALSRLLLLYLGLTVPVPVIVISTLKTERGLALQDLLNGAYDYIDELELKPNSRIYLLDSLATTEYVVPVF